MAGTRNSVELVHDGATRRVKITGRLDVDHFIDAIGQAVMLEIEQPASNMLLDFRAVDEVDLTDDEVFRIVTSVRRRSSSPPDS